MTTEINLSLFNPESSWTPPRGFPDLSGAKRISIDVETKDPHLKERGPGSFRNDGYPTGISVAAKDYKRYFPFKHMCGGNLDEINVINFFKDLLADEDKEVVFSKAIYDLEWLDFLGIEVKGKIRDIQIAEALMDEEQFSYGLPTLAKKYLGAGKDEELLREAASAYGIDPKLEMWKLHSKYVGAYAEGDTEKTLAIFEKQLPMLRQQGLMPVFELESDITPIIWLMRKNGVRIDLEQASKLSKQLDVEENRLQGKMKEMIGHYLDVWAGDDIGRVCDVRDIPYNRTAKTGKPSFNKVFLKNARHPFFDLVREIREVSRLKDVYVDKFIKEHVIDGKCHCEFIQMRTNDDDDDEDEKEGARTGRFGCKNPNLQQIPARNAKIAKLIRALFLPWEGEMWNKNDYSQQEPRIMTHFACLRKFRGAKEVRDAYLTDKTTDFYMLVAREAKLERKPAKDLTLGRCYGEGKDKMARDLGVSVEEAKRVLETFDNANPYIKELAEDVSNCAEHRGFIKTLLGRHQHFNFWEPADWKANKFKESLRREAAEKRWPDMHLRRAFLYKALNKLIQGSAADMTKQAMLLIYRELKRVPLLQVHDELDYSVPGQFEASSIQFRMENCTDITVPMWAESTIGPHWTN